MTYFEKLTPAGIIFVIFTGILLYIYKTRGFATTGRFKKPSPEYVWFQVILLVVMAIWQPWND